MSPRLSLAFETGGLSLPDGRIVVLHPRADADLSALPKDRVTIVQPFYPDYAAWSARGYDCSPTLDGEFAAAVVLLPRSKTQARALVCDAAQVAGLVVIDGAKTDGVDSLLKDLRKRTDVSAPIAKAHGKIFWFTSGADLSDWAAQPTHVDGFQTLPGVFSADGIDPASRMLAEVLPEKLGPRVADLGAGWGYLSAEVLTRASVKELHVVEADHTALACAQINLPDPRAQFHWADARDWGTPGCVDTVVMNPPFHTARAADASLGQAFIEAAARILSPQGTLWMVANRHLPYETALRAAFREGDELAGDARFKLFRAARPSRPRR
ncbi:class I SAM-dependent methyltransferase [Aestuariivita boseongensis]|uniref:class I SAM-dependent methyltransferase n=1 Tax=Aestuariivita boseongensis TaxID=1470562 RepID=UPI00067FBDFD|nr:class I SAM-dependent methyltransferase [Aestuariivita boseongensis]